MVVPVAPTAFTVNTLPNVNAGAGTQLTYAAIDGTNGNSVPCTGKELLIVKNTTGGSLNVTIYSAADSLGRFADITEAIAPTTGEKVYGPFPINGWAQPTSNLLVWKCDATLTAKVLVIP